MYYYKTRKTMTMAMAMAKTNSSDKFTESFNKKFSVNSSNNNSSYSNFKQKKDPIKKSLDITNDLQFPSLNSMSQSKNIEEITLKTTYNSVVSATIHFEEETKEELPKGWVSITFNKTNRNIQFYPILDNKDKEPVTEDDDYDPNLIMMKMSKIVSENREKHKYMYDQIHGNGAFNELHYISRNYLSDEEF